jgi:hypothetical protein
MLRDHLRENRLPAGERFDVASDALLRPDHQALLAA